LSILQERITAGTLQERITVGTQTVGGFKNLPYPSSEPSDRRWDRRWNRGREDTIKVAGEKPDWIDDVVDKLNELARLSKDWDPRGSMPVAFDDAKAAVEFLNRVMRFDSPAPAITPLPSGGLELAWSVGGVALEVVFDSANGERAAILDSEGDECELTPEDAAACVDFLRPQALTTG
jgi:hypothetical protein